MRRNILVISFLLACIMIAGMNYFVNDEEEVNDYYLKTVVYKDSSGTLIPVSLNFYNNMDIEEEVLNRVDMMKSNEFQEEGLYPLLSHNLQVNHVDLDHSILTIDFNDELYANHNALDIIEALTYTLCDYKEVNELKLQINGKEIHSIPNSNIVVSSLTNQIGLNNFQKTTNHLHHTYPVMIYNIKTIKNHDYYVPTTTRINEKQFLKQQIQTIISYIDPNIICQDAKMNNGNLKVTLNSNALLDDGTIDKEVLELMNLSLSSINHVNKVSFIVDNEVIVSESVSLIRFNYIKI